MVTRSAGCLKSSASAPLADRYTITPAMLPDGLADQDGEMLLAVGGVLHREIAIDDLLRRMVDHIRATMEADRGTIYLLDRGKGELFSKVAHLPELEITQVQMSGEGTFCDHLHVKLCSIGCPSGETVDPHTVTVLRFGRCASCIRILGRQSPGEPCRSEQAAD